MEEILEDYRLMLLIRRFEENVLDLFSKGRLKGTIHTCIGQEAIPVAICRLLKQEDWIMSTHRGHGHCIAKGGDIKRLMAEIYGKRSGYCGGRGGSQHIHDFDIGFLGANGITGGGIPIALGAAFSSKYQKNGKVVVCFIGDGAVNQGTFHESLNMAAIWKLPLIIVCENNQYAMYTQTNKTMPTKTISERVSAYSMKGERVDGNDIYAIREVAAKAIEGARENKGPAFIEAVTYRFCGHSGRDKCLYRSREEEEEWKYKCPVTLQRERVLKSGIDHSIPDQIDREVEEQIKESIKFAEQDLPPSMDGLERDMFEYKGETLS